MLSNNKNTTFLLYTSASLIGIVTLFYIYKKRKNEEQKKISKNKQIRCLVTGFNDWRNMNTFQDIWRSEENPSSRIILGKSSKSPPIQKNGPLVSYLKNNKSNSSNFLNIDWSFMTIPTIWSTSLCLDLLYYDIIIHIGLGVYDSNHKILLELNAYNERLEHGKDASGNLPFNKIIDNENNENIIEISNQRKDIIKSFDNYKIPNTNFHVEIANARKENTYICNETHYRSIQAVKQSDEMKYNDKLMKNSSIDSSNNSRLCNSFFIHIPYPELENDYDQLGVAVGILIEKLVEKSLKLDR